MKIQGSQDTLRFHSTQQNTNEFSKGKSHVNPNATPNNAYYDSLPAEVSFTNEGVEYYRKKAAELSGGINNNYEKPFFPENIHNGGVFNGIENALIERINGSRNTANGYAMSRSASGAGSDLLSAYASLYDEIMKGYEDGTREYWVLEQGGVFRKVTKEEELEALYKAFEKHAEFIARSSEVSEGASKAMEAAYRRIEAQRNRGGAKHHIGVSADKEPIDAKQLYDSLMNAVNAIHSQYINYAGDLDGLMSNVLGGFRLNSGLRKA